MSCHISTRQVEGRPHRWDLLPLTLAVQGGAPSQVWDSEQLWWLLSTDPP